MRAYSNPILFGNSIPGGSRIHLPTGWAKTLQRALSPGEPGYMSLLLYLEKIRALAKGPTTEWQQGGQAWHRDFLPVNIFNQTKEATPN